MVLLTYLLTSALVIDVSKAKPIAEFRLSGDAEGIRIMKERKKRMAVKKGRKKGAKKSEQGPKPFWEKMLSASKVRSLIAAYDIDATEFQKDYENMGGRRGGSGKASNEEFEIYLEYKKTGDEFSLKEALGNIPSTSLNSFFARCVRREAATKE